MTVSNFRNHTLQKAHDGQDGTEWWCKCQPWRCFHFRRVYWLFESPKFIINVHLHQLKNEKKNWNNHAKIGLDHTPTVLPSVPFGLDTKYVSYGFCEWCTSVTEDRTCKGWSTLSARFTIKLHSFDWFLSVCSTLSKLRSAMTVYRKYIEEHGT